MKAIGIVRRIDDLGRVVIPRETRKISGIRAGDLIEIFVDECGQIILRKHNVGASYVDQLTSVLEFLAGEEDIPPEKCDQARSLIRQALEALGEAES